MVSEKGKLEFSLCHQFWKVSIDLNGVVTCSSYRIKCSVEFRAGSSLILSFFFVMWLIAWNSLHFPQWMLAHTKIISSFTIINKNCNFNNTKNTGNIFKRPWRLKISSYLSHWEKFDWLKQILMSDFLCKGVVFKDIISLNLKVFFIPLFPLI